METGVDVSRLPLDKAVDFSDMIFWACRRAADNAGWDDFASLALFRHIMQMADGVHLLLSANTSGPTIPLLRSMLESLISLKYIHQADYRQRSLCWVCAYIHQEIAIKELADTETAAGKQLRDIATKEHGSWQPRPNTQKARDDAEALRRYLLKPDLTSIEGEYQRLQKMDRNRPPKWYKLFNGPRNIYEIAQRVGLLALYKVSYGRWSATVHGTGATRLLVKQDDGSAEFKQVRFLDHPEQQEGDAELFLRLAAILMAKKFLTQLQMEKLIKEFFSTLE